MRNTRTAAIVIGLLTTLPAFGLAKPNVGTPSSRTGTSSEASTSASVDWSASPQDAKANARNSKAAKATVHATKGVVKFVDTNKLVITRSPQSGREMTFVLNPSTERVGTMKVGSTVDVRYRTEAEQRVATAVTVVHVKQPPFARGSQQ
jgi:hypothetical protein